MATNRKMTVSNQPTKHRPTSAERRAAEMASLSGRQAELKRESAERRAKREAAATEAAPAPQPGHTDSH